VKKRGNKKQNKFTNEFNEKVLEMDKEVNWKKLSTLAWEARENAFIFGNTKVGSALVTDAEKYFVGCNVEHMFRSHDFHAETNAIGNMIAGGEKKIVAILIAARRERFTPCGGCMDWIFQFGGQDCFVAFQPSPDSEVTIYKASDLMPHYPI